jgi:hypothetical protein
MPSWQNDQWDVKCRRLRIAATRDHCVRFDILPAGNIKITLFWDVTATKLRDITFQDRNINIHLRENLKSLALYNVDLLYFIGLLQTK